MNTIEEQQNETPIHVRLADLGRQVKNEPLILTLKKPGDAVTGEIVRYESECNANHFLVIQNQRGSHRIMINKNLKTGLKAADAIPGSLISIVFIGKIKPQGHIAHDGFKVFRA
ncbi:MAG: hypothetical protein ACXW0Q_05740 [Methylovulum sp.]